MVYCSVAGCKNRSEANAKKFRFYTFPKDDNICKEWVNACGKQKLFKIDCARICTDHFVQSDFQLQDILLKVPKHKRRLRHGAIPSKNLPNEMRLSNPERKRRRLDDKALVAECIASYERKQKQAQSSSGENAYEGAKPAAASLASYVSKFKACELKESTIKSKCESQSYQTPAQDCNRTIFPSENPASSGEIYLKKKRSTYAEKILAFSDLNSNDPSATASSFMKNEHSYSQVKFYTNGATQTEFDYECCKELHIMRLEVLNRKLNAVIKRKSKREQENEALRSSLEGIMTMGQINRLLQPGRQLKWRAEDIASAMSLYSAGPVAYALLRRRNFPLPSSSTLRGWAGKIQIKPGILNSVFQLIQKLNYNEKERLCVLCFNKIRIKASSCSKNSSNLTLKRARYAYVVMIRGLTKDWAHIIYYDINAPVTASVLKSIIMSLEGIHFVVTAVVSDMGPNVNNLCQELNISENQPYFLHPCDELRKIFFYADVLHLIKLLRYRYITSGFALDGKIIDTDPIKEVLNLENRVLNISREHIDINGLLNTKLASQLFSHQVSTAIMKCVRLGKIKTSNALECAGFINTVSDWYDIFNSKESSKAFGSSPEEEHSILTSMSDKIRHLRTPKKQIVLRFQKAILLNNTALPQMLDFVKLKYNINHIITERLNHEELEHFFDVMRAKGGPLDHPTALEFKYRLRSFILGRMVL